jgi:hypothetical protein
MKQQEEIQKRIDFASMELIEAQIRLQTKTRLGGVKAIKTAQMDVVGLMMEINALQWVLEQRTDEESRYKPNQP